MIFFTLGTERFPFKRLIHAAEESAAGAFPEPVVAQIGRDGEPPPAGCQTFGSMAYPQFVDYLKQARIVVSHAGVGTIVSCLRLGIIPIILPRQKRFGEHVDDHQIHFAKKMEEEGHILLAKSQEDIPNLIQEYHQSLAACQRVSSQPQLAAALMDYLGHA